jgi:uncharacterized protein
MSKRWITLFLGIFLCVFAHCAGAADASVLNVPPPAQLDHSQSTIFRAWLVRIIENQLERGPHMRWQQQDCAGLVRFAANEALKAHDAKWLANMQMSNQYLPPDGNFSVTQRALAQRWQQGGGAVGPFVSAIHLVVHNSRIVGRDLNQAKAGDLLYFDQGDDQHLMVWMGRYAAYHNGSSATGRAASDNGLRRLRAQELMHLSDTRWQANATNPNFIGVFRLNILSD